MLTFHPKTTICQFNGKVTVTVSRINRVCFWETSKHQVENNVFIIPNISLFISLFNLKLYKSNFISLPALPFQLNSEGFRFLLLLQVGYIQRTLLCLHNNSCDRNSPILLCYFIIAAHKMDTCPGVHSRWDIVQDSWTRLSKTDTGTQGIVSFILICILQ